MARNTPPQDDEIIDLTELIETGGSSAPPSPAASDFDDLLAGAEAGDGARSAGGGSKPVVDPHEELDMVNMGDIDNLLESLDIPPQPRERAPAPKPAPAAAPRDDLDSVLDDLLGPDSAPAAQRPQEAPAPPAQDSFMDDLDAILGDAGGAPARPKTPPEPKPAPSANIDADLDDILGEFEEAPKPGPAPQPAPAPQESPDEGLDDLLSDLDEKPAPKPAPSRNSVADINLDADLDDILSEVDPPVQEKEVPGPDKFEVPGKVDTGPEEPAPAVTAPLENRPLNLQAVPVPAQVVPQELIAGICQNVMAGRENGMQEAMNDISRQIGAHGAHMEDMVRQTAEFGKRLVACEAKLAATRSRLAKLEKSMEAVATLEDLLKDGTPLHAGFTALISSAVSQALKGFSDKREADPETTARLQALAASENRTSERINLLENRLNDLQTGLTGQIEGAVASAIEQALDQAAASPQADAETIDKLGKLAEREKYSSARMDMLEKRLDELEPNFNAQVEKAAAAAAARILHEEIGKLISGL